MGCISSSCGCSKSSSQPWANLKCRLMNAAAKRQSKKACRCISRRPKCLRYRRKTEPTCSCTHIDCQYAVPPRPVGCGPPIKSSCRQAEPEAVHYKPYKTQCKCVNTECQKNMPTSPPRSPIIERRALSKRDNCKCSNRECQTEPPICPARLASCSPKPKTKKKCECINRECQTESPICPSGVAICVPPKSVPSSRKNSPPIARTSTPIRKTSPKPKGKQASKSPRSPSPSPDQKSLRWKSQASSGRSSRSESPEEISPLTIVSPKPSYLCMCEDGTGDRQKNVCRFTVDAYFT